jgi:hypothetical protein
LGQPPFLPLVPRLFEAHLPDLLHHGCSVHRGPPSTPIEPDNPCATKPDRLCATYIPNEFS